MTCSGPVELCGTQIRRGWMPMRLSLLGRAVARPLGSRQGALWARRCLSSRPLPTKEDADSMPRHVRELPNEQLFTLCESTGHLGAVRERLRREIMTVDNVSYSETGDKLIEMSEVCKVNHGMIKAPYLASVYIALASGWASIPLVFTFPVAQAFNDRFVTAEPPEVGEADTWLEVGAWSWNWMEPPLGTISFFLLCIQFARDQRITLGDLTMAEKIKAYQAKKLQESFPQYNPSFVAAYAEAIAMLDDVPTIKDEQIAIERIAQGEGA